MWSNFINTANNYVDRNFQHVFVLVIMMAVPFIVYPVLAPASLWTVFAAFYVLSTFVMQHYRSRSRQFQRLNLDKSLWS